jgi:outer membrane beta-barrel protein
MKALKIDSIKLSILILILFLSKSVFAEEKDLYKYLWLDPDKSVYVLQNKLYEKKNTFYADVGFLKGLSSEFQSTRGAQLRVGYYFHEEWAIELMGNIYQNSDNDTFKNLTALNDSVPFTEKLERSYGALAVWSPFYGKINTFNKIYYFDWSFGLGLGQVELKTNADTVASSATANEFNKKKTMAIMGKSLLRFHINEKWHVGLEYLNTSYESAGPKLSTGTQTEKWRSNSDVIFSVGFSF